jgi:hypothetical protein
VKWLGLVPAHAKGIRDAIDVVKPGGNQGNLKYPAIVEANLAKSLVIIA